MVDLLHSHQPIAQPTDPQQRIRLSIALYMLPSMLKSDEFLGVFMRSTRVCHTEPSRTCDFPGFQSVRMQRESY